MKLEKETERRKAAAERWYDDACGTAFAMELVGERWSLLIVRELMYGGRRFSELKASLLGISANILTQRLAGLEEAGILQRRKLPPPASVQIYELTPWGYSAEPAIQSLGRWAVQSARHDPTLPLSAASIMMSFRTMLNSERAAGLRMVVGFRFGEESFVARLGSGVLPVTREDPALADVVFNTDPVTLASIVYGGRPIADAEAEGTLRLSGDRQVAERFVTLFVLPEKIA